MSLPPHAAKKTGFPQPWEACRFFGGAPEGSRTPDQELRRLLLYPTELRAHGDNAVQLPADSRVSGLANSPRRAASSVA